MKNSKRIIFIMVFLVILGFTFSCGQIANNDEAELHSALYRFDEPLPLALALPIPIKIVRLPFAPANLTAEATGPNEIILNWEDGSSNEAGFKIFRSLTGNTEDFVLLTATEANVTSFTDQGLKAHTEYFYFVKAFNVRGDSLPSNQVSAVTSEIELPPDTPIITDAYCDFWSDIHVDWNASTGADHYQLHYECYDDISDIYTYDTFADFHAGYGGYVQYNIDVYAIGETGLPSIPASTTVICMYK